MAQVSCCGRKGFSVESVPSPNIPRLDDSPWVFDGLESLERLEQDGPLLIRVKGLPQRVAEGITEGEGPRGSDPLCDLFLERDTYGGNAPGLNRSLDQAHGLVAQASGRREKNGLDPLPKEAFGNLGGCLVDKGLEMRAVDVSHEAIQGRADASNNSLIPEFPESIDGEDYIDVAVCRGMIVVLVGNREIRSVRIRREGPKACVPIRVFHVEGWLRLQVDAGRGHHRNAALSQRFAERGPGDAFPLDEPVAFGPTLRQPGEMFEKLHQ